MWSIPLQIYEAARTSVRAVSSLSLSQLFLSLRMSSSHVGSATLPTTIRHSIYIWIKLLHAIPGGLRGSREPRDVSIE